MNEKLTDDFINQLIIFCLKKRENYELTYQHVKLEFFPDDSQKRLWTAIRVEFDAEGRNKLPNLSILTQIFRSDTEVLQLISDTRRTDEVDDDSVRRNLEIFLKKSMFVYYINEISDLFNKGKQSEASALWATAADKYTKFSLNNEATETVLKNFEKRMMDRDFDKVNLTSSVRIPTGIDELDRNINGIETGEFALILGDSGSGKSFLGNHLGLTAVRFGVDVYHVQAEGTKKQVMNRYDSAFTGTSYFDVKVNDFSVPNLQTARKSIKSSRADIYVDAFEQFGTISMIKIRNRVIELKRIANIKLVIIDYLDLIDPGDSHSYGPKDERFRQQKVAKLCKNLAMEQDVAVVAFTQASSMPPEDLNNPNFVITRFNLSEDKGKVRPADIFLTINRTKDERSSNVCRLYLDKAREHPGQITIKIVQNLKMSRFYDLKKTHDKFYNHDND